MKRAGYVACITAKLVIELVGVLRVDERIILKQILTISGTIVRVTFNYTASSTGGQSDVST